MRSAFAGTHLDPGQVARERQAALVAASGQIVSGWRNAAIAFTVRFPDR